MLEQLACVTLEQQRDASQKSDLVGHSAVAELVEVAVAGQRGEHGYDLGKKEVVVVAMASEQNSLVLVAAAAVVSSYSEGL